MAHIALSGIRKSFDETDVLKGIDLSISTGEFITLVGPSGCGKSTLLRIIAGLETQTSGDVAIADEVVNKVRPSHRNLAMVFQSYALYPHLTVRGNIETPLKLRDLSHLQRLPFFGRWMMGARQKQQAIDTLVNEVAEILKIESLMERKPGQLSGGQRQRVALGRAMVRKPVAFLMDEPLSNLDAALRVHMRAELAELHRRLGITFIYVTHDQAEALTMSDRMAVMMDGELLQVGAPSDVYKNPIDRRVAEFVGSPRINILPAEKGADGSLSVLGLSLNQCVEAGEAQDVVVGFRPEHTSIGPAAREFKGLQLTVTHKENLGSEFFVHGHLGDGKHPYVTRAEPSIGESVSIGDILIVTPDRRKALAFGADNRRLTLKGLEIGEAA